MAARRVLSIVGEDIHYAALLARRCPVIACAIFVTVAVFAGWNAGAFAFINAMLLRSPAGDRIGFFRIITKHGSLSAGNWSDRRISSEEYTAYRNASRSIADLSAEITIYRTPVRWAGTLFDTSLALVSCNQFSIYAVAEPMLGRKLDEHDCNQSALPVAVISEECWRGSLASDPSAVGSRISVMGRDTLVIGVMPAGISGIMGVHMWLPNQPAMAASGGPLIVSGRLRPGHTRSELYEALNGTAQRLNQRRGSRITQIRIADGSPIDTILSGGGIGRGIGSLIMGVITLLLVCLLLALLLLVLSRELAIRQKIATRLLLCTSHGRLVRMLVFEIAFLSALAGLVAVPFARWLPGVLGSILAPGVPEYFFRSDHLVSAFVAALVIVAIGVTGFPLPRVFDRANSFVHRVAGTGRLIEFPRQIPIEN
jgi:hypothetical protein